MADDPLAAYRKTPAIPAGGSEIPHTGIEEYAAFGTKDRVNRLRIHSLRAPSHSLNSNILLDIIFDAPEGTNFILQYTVLTVLVRGRNLQKMVFAIENEMACFIQEFDPKRWEKPKDASAAFIASIEILVNKGGATDSAMLH